MNFFTISLVTTALALASLAHEHDHADQMPLSYVKYPYQATYYPGDNDGKPVELDKASEVQLL